MCEEHPRYVDKSSTDTFQEKKQYAKYASSHHLVNPCIQRSRVLQSPLTMTNHFAPFNLTGQVSNPMHQMMVNNQLPHPVFGNLNTFAVIPTKNRFHFGRFDFMNLFHSNRINMWASCF